MSATTPPVAIIMGSQSDWATMRHAAQTLDALAGFLATRGAAAETVLLRAVEALQGERYLTLAERRPANEAFLYGWLAQRIG